MLNVLDHINGDYLFKKFKVDDLTFVEYKCLLEETRSGYWTHHNYFVYVLGGNKKWETSRKEYFLSDGEAVFVRKGSYLAHKLNGEDFCALMVFVPDDFIKAVLNKFALPVPSQLIPHSEIDGIIPVALDDTLHSYFSTVLSYFRKDESPPKELLTLKFEELILTLLLNDKNQALHSYFRTVAETSKVSIPLIMEANFMRNLSLEEYARLCARSLSVFKSDFSAIYETTPGKWLVKKRLEYSRQLIETTDLTVIDVAFESGFKNTSHFIRVFKESYGTSPLRYRISC